MKGGSEGVVMEANLSRKAYLSGDDVEAQVSFTFAAPSRSHEADERVHEAHGQDHHPEEEPMNPGKAVTVDWVSIQLHGHLVYDHRVIDFNSVFPSLARVNSEESIDPHSPKPRTSSSVSSRFFASPRVYRRFSSAEIDVKGGSNVQQSEWREVLAAPMGHLPDFSKFAGKHGFCMFLTEPEVLDCEVQVQPNSTTEYMFRYVQGRLVSGFGLICKRIYRCSAKLPQRIPPTYRGSCVRHFYVLSVGAKLSSSDRAHVLHVPLRVLGPSRVGNAESESVESSVIVDDGHEFNVQSYSLRKVIDSLAVGRFEAFLKTPLRVIDSDLMGMWRTGSRKDTATHVYRIGSEAKHMARLSLFKTTVIPGEEILLVFDFADASIPCYQISVGIEVEEERKHEPPLQSAFVPLTDGEGNVSSVGKAPSRQVLVSRHEVVANNQQFSMIMQVPDDACPDFETELVKVSIASHMPTVRLTICRRCPHICGLNL